MLLWDVNQVTIPIKMDAAQKKKIISNKPETAST